MAAQDRQLLPNAEEGLLTEVAKKISYSAPKTQFIARFAGDVATYQYWCRHPFLTGKLFTQRLQMASSGYEICLEISPRPAILNTNTEGDLLSSLPQESASYSQFLHCLGELYLQGVVVWSGFDRDYLRRLVVLPTYPFQRQRYWFE
jgi:acyl transferase domain-containing protein